MSISQKDEKTAEDSNGIFSSKLIFKVPDYNQGNINMNVDKDKTASGDSVASPERGPPTEPHMDASGNNSESNVDTEKSLRSNLIRKRRSTTVDIPGLTSSLTSPNGTLMNIDSKLIIIMVGLPARGKSYITKKLARYLNWIHHECKIFNVGNTRRKHQKEANAENAFHDSEFFNFDNIESKKLREKWAMDTLDELLDYLINDNGLIGIFDATNTTRSRRYNLIKRIHEKLGNRKIKILFIESICNDFKIIENNIILKMNGPDYAGLENKNLAIRDFLKRVENYEKIYETIDEFKENKIFSGKRNSKVQYIKIINVGQKIINYNINGFLAISTANYLLSFNLTEKLIILSRSGESLDNQNGKIGGDSSLTKRGKAFSKCFSRWIDDLVSQYTQDKIEQTKLEDIYKIDYYNEITRFTLKGLEENEDNTKKERRSSSTGLKEHSENTSVDGGCDRITNNKRFVRKHEIISDDLYFDKNEEAIVDSDDDDGNDNIDNYDSNSDESSDESEYGNCNLSIWTSRMKRTIETSNYFSQWKYSIKRFKMLDQQETSEFSGMTYNEILRKYPEEFERRLEDKINYCYPGPGGESYLQVIDRLKPLIMEIERLKNSNLLIISHRVILRILLGYFLNLNRKQDLSNLRFPLHTVYVLVTKTYGIEWKVYEFDQSMKNGKGWFKEIDKMKYINEINELDLRNENNFGEYNKSERKFSILPTDPTYESQESAPLKDDNGDVIDIDNNTDNIKPFDMNYLKDQLVKLRGRGG